MTRDFGFIVRCLRLAGERIISNVRHSLECSSAIGRRNTRLGTLRARQVRQAGQTVGRAFAVEPFGPVDKEPGGPAPSANAITGDTAGKKAVTNAEAIMTGTPIRDVLSRLL
jgi:hypothetical protein